MSKISTKLKLLVLPAIAAAGFALLSPANADAGQVQLDIQLGSNLYSSVQHRQAGYYYNPGYYQPYYHPRYQPRRHYKPRRHCGPRRAIKVAWKRYGLYDPWIHRVGEKRIVVKGFDGRYMNKLVFKRHSNCRLIKKVQFYR